MVLRLNAQPKIENLRNYPAEMVEQLRELLISGAPAKLDAHRKDFYEVENCSQVFYVHVSPGNGTVMLLAIWQKDAQPVAALAASPVA